ncbi:helix-turn-helix domain-containing protein [Paenibacillus sp. FSL L8-0340]|uniref:winged helix-turn-helix transcriptional regulator n=1 Tax=Paenibacillus sp. FSL L8-0340 TaxID=2954685 RepID=UPI0031597C7F
METELLGNCSPCPVEFTVNIIGGKWKLMILYHLLDNDMIRFNQLQKKLSSVTHRTLTRQLRELEEDGVVNRVTFAEVPPRVEYSLTDKGKSLTPMLLQMRDWGLQHM